MFYPAGLQQRLAGRGRAGYAGLREAADGVRGLNRRQTGGRLRVGRALARDLSTLQDRLPPFSQDDAVNAVEAELEAPLGKIYEEFGPPVAAASIATRT